MSNWQPTRESCQDDWQRALWDAAENKGLVFGSSIGVVKAMGAALDFFEKNDLVVPYGLRDAILNCMDDFHG